MPNSPKAKRIAARRALKPLDLSKGDVDEGVSSDFEASDFYDKMEVWAI